MYKDLNGCSRQKGKYIEKVLELTFNQCTEFYIIFLFVDPSTKGLSTLEMPRESSSAPTLEAGAPETSSHSSISSKISSADYFSCTFILEHCLLPCFQFFQSWYCIYILMVHQLPW